MIPTQEVGRLWVPELSKLTYLPGRAKPVKSSYVGVVSFAVRDAKGRKTQAGFGLALSTAEGLVERWKHNEALQRIYPTPDTMLAAMRWRLERGNIPLPRGVVHNERVDNGGKMQGTLFWGIASGTTGVTNATVNSPTRIALCTLSTFAAAHGDQSLGTGTANSTTNEATTNGMSRTGSLTPSGWTAPSALNGQYSFTIANTFTDATAASDIYGAALFDNTTAASNMYAEASHAHANPQVGDTLTETWTIND